MKKKKLNHFKNKYSKSIKFVKIDQGYIQKVIQIKFLKKEKMLKELKLSQIFRIALTQIMTVKLRFKKLFKFQNKFYLHFEF